MDPVWPRGCKRDNRGKARVRGGVKLALDLPPWYEQQGDAWRAGGERLASVLCGALLGNGRARREHQAGQRDRVQHALDEDYGHVGKPAYVVRLGTG